MIESAQWQMSRYFPSKHENHNIAMFGQNN